MKTIILTSKTILFCAMYAYIFIQADQVGIKEYVKDSFHDILNEIEKNLGVGIIFTFNEESSSRTDEKDNLNLAGLDYEHKLESIENNNLYLDNPALINVVKSASKINSIDDNLNPIEPLIHDTSVINHADEYLTHVMTQMKKIEVKYVLHLDKLEKRCNSIP